MKIEHLETSSIIPYEKNNRLHNDAQVALLVKSIEDFGFTQPIVIDEENVILAGHGRFLAAQKLELKKVPVHRGIGWSEEKKKAYRILDNKIQNDSEWDFANLQSEIQALEDAGYDVDQWGLHDLNDLLPDTETSGESKPSQAKEDSFTMVEPENTRINRGHVIELGDHMLLCADVSALLDSTIKFDMWLTDPPYGVSYVGKTKDALTIENDDLDTAGVEALWAAATGFALRNLKEGASCYASIPSGPPYFNFLKIWIEQQIYRQQLIWAKNSMVLGHSDYHYKHESILYGWKPGAAHSFVEDRTKTSLLEFDRPQASADHPTMKPVRLWAELISNSSKPGDTVLDTFAGSGTTLIACEETGRKSYNVEIEPKYCEVIIRRYEAHCKETGKPFLCKINGEEAVL